MLKLEIPKEPTPPQPEAAEMLATNVAAVCAEAASVCVGEYESASPGSVDELKGRVDSLLSRSLDLLSVVSIMYSEPEEAPEEVLSEDSDEGRPSSIPPDVEAISDVVVLARMGLRSRQRMLAGLGAETSRWEVLSVVGSSLRTVQKSLSAVDRAMSKATRAGSAFEFYDHALPASLDVRRRYVHFHRAVTGGGAPAAGDLRVRFRRVGNAIAQMLGKTIAIHMRTGDRALLMMTQANVRRWLAEDQGDPAHHTAGLRLYQDIANVAAMLLDVSRREELVRHDALIARDEMHRIQEVNDWQPEDAAEARRRLLPMLGRSAALDALIEPESGPAGKEKLLTVLAEVSRTLAAAIDAHDPPPSGPRAVQR